jgi:hypothetical protein
MGGLPVSVLELAARRRRAKGFYDGRTLALFRRAWVRGRSMSTLLDYALFRRDLGFPLATRWAAPLRAGLAQLPTRRRRVAAALLAEVDGDSGWNGGAQAGGAGAALQTMQDAWRDAFVRMICEQRRAGVCVVGNAGMLIGAGLGTAIDGHGVVVRFNRFRAANSNEIDIGSRVDVWVAAPGFEGPPPVGVKWIVVSGPDMRFRRQNWESLRPALDAGAAVLTVPLGPWRSLVAQLQAPPSAGVLFLAWLRSVLGSWQGVRAIGFGMPAGGAGTYHHADPHHKAVERHNWTAERALLLRWHDEGLKLGSDD